MNTINYECLGPDQDTNISGVTSDFRGSLVDFGRCRSSPSRWKGLWRSSLAHRVGVAACGVFDRFMFKQKKSWRGVQVTSLCTKPGAIKNRPSLSSKSCVLLLIIIAHALKSHKSSTYSISLKLNCEDRATSPLSYLYLYRIFKCFLMKLCAFQNGIFRKNFGVTGLSSEMAGFQLRPPS